MVLFVHITNPDGEVLEAVEIIEDINPIVLASQIAGLLERRYECRTGGENGKDNQSTA